MAISIYKVVQNKLRYSAVLSKVHIPANFNDFVRILACQQQTVRR